MKWSTDLITDIRTHSDLDDLDDPSFWTKKHPTGYTGAEEVTECNINNLQKQFLNIRNQCSSILEIGVHRNGMRSFTNVFLQNKTDDCYYFGIDIDDRAFLNNPSKKIHTICNTSSDIEGNMKIINTFGVSGFDFIFIDGWHSINQVYLDWEYTNWLSDHGVVGFHDVSCHPGPSLFINALNQNKWDIICNTCPNDWGIGFASKKHE